MITLAGYCIFVHLMSLIVLQIRHTMFRGTCSPIPDTYPVATQQEGKASAGGGGSSDETSEHNASA